MILLESENSTCYVFPKVKESDRLKDWVSVVGHQKVLPGEKYPKTGFPDACLFKENGGRCIDAFQLLFITQGSGYFIDRGVEYDISGGEIFILRPGYWHSYAPLETTGWSEYFIGFEGELFSKIMEDGLPRNGSNVFMLNNAPEIVKIFNKALEVAKHDDQDTQLLLCSFLTLLISGIIYGKVEAIEDSRSTSRLVARARSFMENNINSKLSLSRIADEMGVSYTSFSMAFKEQTGLSPVRYFNLLKLQRAKYKLMKTNSSIKQIALECGFSSLEYFCNFFKEETGMTPAVYRNQNLGLGGKAE